MSSDKPAFKALIWVLRIVVGGVFVMSGLAKMIDLYGFVFKIEEYLAAWGMTEPRSLVLIAAMAISGYEFVLGLLLAMGCYKRVAPWGLMLSMVVMLPLTFYIMVAEPVSDCGCFGDFWVISNTATFIKNLFITAAIALLILWNGKLRSGLFKPAIQWIVGAWISLYVILVGLIGYNVQPVADFRPFPKGTSLAATDDDGSTEYAFIYERDGERREFGIDEQPDSTWTFIDRVATSDDDTLRPDFAIFDGDDDVTEDVVEPEGYELMLIIPEPVRADVSFTYYINELYEKADSAGIPMIGLLATDEEGLEMWKDLSMASYPLYTADDTQLKELSRGVMSLVVLKDGRIISKSTMSYLVNETLADGIDGSDIPGCLTVDTSRWMKFLTLFFAAVLLLLYLFQGLILAVKHKIWRKFKKKNVTLQRNDPQADPTVTGGADQTVEKNPNN